MAKVRSEKTINLTALKPSEYHLWACQSEATFRVYGVLDIVLGRNPKPAVSEQATTQATDELSDQDAAVQALAPISAAQRRSIEKWQQQDDLARQALLACLETAELTKVYQLQSAHEIWARLAEEYGPVSDIRRAQAEGAFYSLRKQHETSMQDHINEFTRLQQEVDYHRGTIPALSSVQINLTFLRSLGRSWASFQQSMGPRIHTIKPATLFAEVLAFQLQNPDKDETEYSAKVYTARYDRFYRPHNRPHPYSKPINYNPSEFCTFCKRKGHLIEGCLKKLWRDTQGKEDEKESEKESEKRVVPYDWKSASTTKMNWSKT
jgi:hypothetical protein